MNIKGTAAGGGNALLIPMTEFSLGLTGDINDIMNAHNLAMVALTSRMQHERNYTDEQLAKRELRRLDIDPKNVEMGWIIDFCAQALRNIIIGIGGKKDGFMMQSRFGIAVGSELMAILAIVTRPGRPARAHRQDHRRLRQDGQAGHHRRPRGGRRHDRLDAQHDQPDPLLDRRGPARAWSTPARSPTSPSASPRSSPTASASSCSTTTSPRAASPPTSASRSSGT